MPMHVSADSSALEPRSILLIDDDTRLCSLMEKFFAQHGFHLEAAHDGRSGLARAITNSFDLVLLDVMLPILDGFELLRRIRQRSPAPVIMLTARTGQHDRIAGLNAGADDYLPKPFRPEELLARIRAILRRAAQQISTQPSIVEVDTLRIDNEARRVSYAGAPIDLTPIEFDIIDFLVRSAGRIVSRNELAVAIYQRQATPYDERAIDVHMCHLRRKLGRDNGVIIRTVRGAGYLFSMRTGELK
jgi:two-component system response regulator CpxR